MTAPKSYERDYEQVHAAITRHAERSIGKMHDDSAIRRFAASAQALAILAVMSLAQDRGVSVEAVLDEFHDYY